MVIIRLVTIDCKSKFIVAGSYNKFKHRVHITSTVISSLDFVTSIIASVLVFSILGAQAKETGIPLKDLVRGGQKINFRFYIFYKDFNCSP